MLWKDLVQRGFMGWGELILRILLNINFFLWWWGFVGLIKLQQISSQILNSGQFYSLDLSLLSGMTFC